MSSKKASSKETKPVAKKAPAKKPAEKAPAKKAAAPAKKTAAASAAKKPAKAPAKDVKAAKPAPKAAAKSAAKPAAKPAKAEPKKAEKKPAAKVAAKPAAKPAKAEPKKAAAKPAAKPAKAEPKKVAAKPAKAEPKKAEKKPAVKAAAKPVKEEPKKVEKKAAAKPAKEEPKKAEKVVAEKPSKKKPVKEVEPEVKAEEVVVEPVEDKGSKGKKGGKDKPAAETVEVDVKKEDEFDAFLLKGVKKLSKTVMFVEIDEQEDRSNKKKMSSEMKNLEMKPTASIRHKISLAEETQEELTERILKELEEQNLAFEREAASQMCTRCNRNLVSPEFWVDKHLGYCEECAFILKLGQSKEARKVEYQLGGMGDSLDEEDDEIMGPDADDLKEAEEDLAEMDD